MSDPAPSTPGDFVAPRPKAVAPGALRRWLAAGWRDLTDAPGPSLFYGVVLAGMGFVLTRWFAGAVGIALTTGFLLVGPFLAIGLYDISRRRELGEPVRLAPTLVAWKANLPAIGFYALMLTLLLAVWIRVSVVVVALFFPDGRIDWSAPDAWAFGAAYAAAGSGLALFVFATSSLSLPALLERSDLDTITAAIASFNALRLNFAVMVAWAACIVLATAIGFATYFAGLVVILPLVGHMTWHAYRESVAAWG
jgi:uncharacterized membrane protein